MTWFLFHSQVVCDGYKKSKKKLVQIEMNIMVLNKVSIRKSILTQKEIGDSLRQNHFDCCCSRSMFMTKFGIIWCDFSIKLAIRVNLHQHDFPLSLCILAQCTMYMSLEEVYCCEKTPKSPISLNKITIWYILNRITMSPFCLVSKTLPP